jgi:dienelactone hydrolase
MPDLFDGDAAPNSAVVPEEEVNSILDTFKIKAAETAKSFMIDMWLARHTEEKVMPLLFKVLDACKMEFADAVSNGGGVYAAGYCFGGRYVLLLGSDWQPIQGWGATQKPADEEAGTVRKGPYIKAGSLAHGTLVCQEDFPGVKVPVSLVCVENDPMFADDVRTTGEDTLSKNNVEHEVKVYPGMPHGTSTLLKGLSRREADHSDRVAGFAVVGDYEDAKIKEAQVTAFEQMLAWIKSH